MQCIAVAELIVISQCNDRALDYWLTLNINNSFHFKQRCLQNCELGGDLGTEKDKGRRKSFNRIFCVSLYEFFFPSDKFIYLHIQAMQGVEYTL